MHVCIEGNCSECMKNCAAEIRQLGESGGCKNKMKELFNCYNDCAIELSLSCFIENGDCLENCKEKLDDKQWFRTFDKPKFNNFLNKYNRK